jgi:hypothetical protein
VDCFIYAADVYCEDCGRDIRSRIKREGFAPTDPSDESSYDSDEFPKGPYSGDEMTGDTPDHCACGPECLNALELADGLKVGCFLENPLTLAGERYVKEMHTESRSEITRLWMDHYGLNETDDDKTDDD